MARRIRTLLGVAAMGLAAGCGGTASPAVTAGTAPPATESPTAPPVVATTEPTPTSGWPGGTAIGPGQVPALLCEDDQDITLYAVDRTTLALEQVGTAALGDVLSGWRGDGSATCFAGGSWSKDLTKVLIQAIPPGNSSDDTHIALVDVVAGSVTDLTAPRQGTSFASTQLDEKNPVFLDKGRGGTADLVAFDQSQDLRTWKTVRLSDPTTLGTVPDTYVRAHSTESWGPAADRLFASTNSNPARTLRVSGYGGTRTIVVGNRPDESGRVIECGQAGVADSIGWLDDRRVLVVDTDAVVRVATVAADGAARCSGPVIPANDRNVQDVFLLPDLRHLAFRANDAAAPDGTSWFRMPVAGGAPERITLPEWPEDLVVVFPWPQT